MNLTSERPLVALGHVFFKVPEFKDSIARIKKLGFRTIFESEEVCVLEVRGGTHFVIQPLKDGEQAQEEVDIGPDFMYDDVDAARELFVQAGFECTEVKRGSIHDEFWARAPEKFKIHVNSSHASGLAV